MEKNRQDAYSASTGRALMEGAVVVGVGIGTPYVLKRLGRSVVDWAANKAADTLEDARAEVVGEADEGPLHDAASFALRIIDSVRDRLDEEPQVRR